MLHLIERAAIRGSICHLDCSLDIEPRNLHECMLKLLETAPMMNQPSIKVRGG